MSTAVRELQKLLEEASTKKEPVLPVSDPWTGKVDMKRGIIEGVKVLPLDKVFHASRGGSAIVPEQVAADALHMFEGARVFLNHAANPRADRRVEDVWGKIINPMCLDGWVEADLKYNRKHVLTPLLLECVERFGCVGLSAVFNGMWERPRRGRGGAGTYTQIDEVESVDLVATPASNEGLIGVKAREQLSMSIAASKKRRRRKPVKESKQAKRPTFSELVGEIRGGESAVSRMLTETVYRRRVRLGEVKVAEIHDRVRGGSQQTAAERLQERKKHKTFKQLRESI